MRKLRKFSVFLLFITLFGVLAYALFYAPLGDMAQNVRDGSGERIFVRAAQGFDGRVYAVRQFPAGDYRLMRLEGAKCVSEHPLVAGLPADYEIDSLHVAGDGSVLLGVFVRNGAELLKYALYAAPDAETFGLLLESPIAGATVPERRQSAGVLACEADGALVQLVVLQEGKYQQYAFDPAQEQGLIAKGELASAQAAELAEQERAVLAQARTLAQNGLKTAKISYLAPTPQGGALAVLDDAALYAISPAGELQNLSAGLYRTVWQSALILIGVVLLVLVLSYGFYYLVCEAKKLYFPLVVKNCLWLSLVGFLAVSAAMVLLVAPAYSVSIGDNVQSALRAQAEQIAAQEDAVLADAAAAIAKADVDYADVTVLRFGAAAEGGWVVQDASYDAAVGILASDIPGEAERIARASEKGVYTDAVFVNGDPHYFAYAHGADGSLLSVQINGRAIGWQISDTLLQIALFSYGTALLLVLLALAALGGAVRGARRVTKGIDLLSMGAPQVRVVQQSGDELAALAAAFNDLSGMVEKRQKGLALTGNAYLRFVPQRLVSLLGASDIEKVDKNTSASHEMAVMVVRFAFPKALYLSDAQVLFDSINEVFAHIAGAVSGTGGAIYNFTHDGFDAVFEEGSLCAVGAAVAVRQALLDLNAERAARGDGVISLRVALDYGTVMMGVVGDSDRVVPTVVSSCLTTARHLVALAGTTDANILCTTAVADAAEGYGLRYIGKCREGGGAIRVYELYDGDPYSMRLAKESMRESFSSGVYALYSGEFSEAKRLFMEIARRQSEDGVARHYLYLADRFEKHAPEWIGLN